MLILIISIKSKILFILPPLHIDVFMSIIYNYIVKIETQKFCSLFTAHHKDINDLINKTLKDVNITTNKICKRIIKHGENDPFWGKLCSQCGSYQVYIKEPDNHLKCVLSTIEEFKRFRHIEILELINIEGIMFHHLKVRLHTSYPWKYWSLYRICYRIYPTCLNLCRQSSTCFAVFKLIAWYYVLFRWSSKSALGSIFPRKCQVFLWRRNYKARYKMANCYRTKR